LRDQLKKLEELQKFDAQIAELNQALQAIPAKLEATKNDLVRVEALLANERAQLAETQRYYNDQKQLVETDEESLSGSKNKQAASRNTKEFSAAQRELDNSRESIAARQAEMAKLSEAIQGKEKLLAERDADVKQLRSSVERDTGQSMGKLSELQGKIAALRVDRDKIAQTVRADVLKRYVNIKVRRGSALAAVEAGTCRGCNMNIPPQLFNVLQRATTVETCPYCHRIIYWDEIMKDPLPEGQTPPAPVAATKTKATKTKAATKKTAQA
jgi:predicted  nucleic acid-binding Zn-ribbon protein